MVRVRAAVVSGFGKAGMMSVSGAPGLFEGQGQRGIALHFPFAFEVADAMLVEYDASNGEGHS